MMVVWTFKMGETLAEIACGIRCSKNMKTSVQRSFVTEHKNFV
jgi:hypothetical protein